MPSHPNADKHSPATLLFDGVCNLCNGFVVFVLKRDPHGKITFAPFQSAAGRRLLEKSGLDPSSGPDSLVLIENGRAYRRSGAALRVARRLRFPWPLLYILIVIPRPVRDAVYDWVARNRYHWFGKKDVCMTPEPGWKDRFL